MEEGKLRRGLRYPSCITKNVALAFARATGIPWSHHCLMRQLYHHPYDRVESAGWVELRIRIFMLSLRFADDVRLWRPTLNVVFTIACFVNSACHHGQLFWKSATASLKRLGAAASLFPQRWKTIIPSRE